MPLTATTLTLSCHIQPAPPVGLTLAFHRNWRAEVILWVATGGRMSVNVRLTRLEAKLDSQSTRHYLWVCGRYGESKQAAVDRYLRERGIILDDVGYV